MEISEKASIKAHPDVLTKQVGESCVLLNLKTESYYGLDAVGYAFYSRLISCGSIAEALQQLVEEYDAEPEEIKKDLFSLVDELNKAQVISISNA